MSSSTVVVILRAASLLAFIAAPLLLRIVEGTGRRKAGKQRAHVQGLSVVANFAAMGLFFLGLILSPDASNRTALALAISGFLLASAGAALIAWSRLHLGAAWSLAPAADEVIGLITSGPYRIVRHPIYLGFLMLAAGQAMAFSSWRAFLILLVAVAPTFVWRARAEEKVLNRVLGESFAAYRKVTPIIIPLSRCFR